MKIYRKLSAICLAAASLAAGCSQDYITDGNDLYEDGYPVNITSVSITGECSEQPWEGDAPQSRMTDNGDGNTTGWSYNDTEIFYVKFSDSDKTGTYRVKRNQAIDIIEPLYWRSKTNEENFIAWYTEPNTDNGGTLNLSDQTGGLVYVLRDDEATGKYGAEVNLNFRHQLAKVRVWVQGTGYEGNAEGVTINSVPASCTVADGEITGQSVDNGSIRMYQTTVNNAVCFEANVLPGTLKKDKAFTVTIGNTEHNISLESDLTLTAATVNTVSLRLQKNGTTVVDLSQLNATYTISGNGTYFFHGTGNYGIRIISGNPQIHLANVAISATTGNAIDITSGSPTLYVQGNSSVKSSNGAGIFVASGSTATIQSSGSSGNTLTVQAGGEAAGIGGSATSGTSTNCGNITIKNIRLTARGSSGNGGACPGIGGAGSGTCGTIKIENSYVYTYGATSGSNHAPGIGSAQPAGGSSPAAPRCEISGSTINSYRGNINWYTTYADYIGQGGNSDNPHGSANDGMNLGGGSCRSTTVYGWTDNMQKIIYYDANGNKM